jgi:hypothetical protein
LHAPAEAVSNRSEFLMKVIAQQRGFYGGQMREVGDTFEVTHGEKASWFSPVAAEVPSDADVRPPTRASERRRPE